MANRENVTAAEVSALGKRLEDLRKSYERYFLGVDKLEPTGDRRRFQMELDSVLGAPSPNTQVKFHVAQVKGKYLTLQQHWNRILREIEDGTYQRDRFRLDLKEKQRADGKKPDARPAAGAPGGVDADVIDRVFRAYVLAKEKCKEPTEGVSRERLADMLAKHASKFSEASPGTRPDFKVVIKDGKARIVARGSGEPRTDTVSKR